MSQASNIPLLKDRRGNSLVESALLLPLVLLMCCGTMDFARVMYAGITVANASRAGVQLGALTPGNAGNTTAMAQAAIDDAADLGTGNVTASARNYCLCPSGTAEVACSSVCGTAAPNGYVAVTTNYTFNTTLRYPLLPSSVVLSRTASMRAQ